MQTLDKAATREEVHEEHTPFYGSLGRIFTTTHHEDIGLLYITTSFFFFFLAGVAALLMRAHLASPELQLYGPAMYNRLFTTHGTSMIFLWIIPVLAGFGNLLLPKQIGAKDMHWPKWNAVGYWLIPVGGFLIWYGLADIGWTGYTPLSILQQNPGIDFWILGLHILGISSIISAINFIMTIFKDRAPGITFRNLSLFVWSILATSILTVGATPVLAVALAMVLADRHMGTHFFLPSGGDTLLYQHMFWFYSHPAVYIMILPAMGLVSDILPKMARRPIMGYSSIAASSMMIAVLGFMVWAHHMFTSGMSIEARLPFMFMTMVVAIPSGIKVINWTGTLYKGRLNLRVPMKFCLSFIATFIIAGITGVFQASIPVDYILHHTYWVVGHLHWMLFGASTQGVFAAMYYYFPKITGRMYDERQATAHWLLTNIGLYVLFFSMLFMGIEGMPRRYYNYDLRLQPLNAIATSAAYAIAAGQLVFLYNLFRSWFKGKPAPKDPWA